MKLEKNAMTTAIIILLSPIMNSIAAPLVKETSKEGALVCYDKPHPSKGTSLVGKTHGDFDPSLVRDTSQKPYHHKLWLKGPGGDYKQYVALNRHKMLAANASNPKMREFITKTYPTEKAWSLVGSGNKPAHFSITGEYFISKSSDTGNMKEFCYLDSAQTLERINPDLPCDSEKKIGLSNVFKYDYGHFSEGCLGKPILIQCQNKNWVQLNYNDPEFKDYGYISCTRNPNPFEVVRVMGNPRRVELKNNTFRINLRTISDYSLNIYDVDTGKLVGATAMNGTAPLYDSSVEKNPEIVFTYPVGVVVDMGNKTNRVVRLKAVLKKHVDAQVLYGTSDGNMGPNDPKTGPFEVILPTLFSVDMRRSSVESAEVAPVTKINFLEASKLAEAEAKKNRSRPVFNSIRVASINTSQHSFLETVGTREIFKSFSHSGASQYDPLLLEKGIDFSGIAWDNFRAGTAIAPSAILLAHHYSRQVGSKIYFWTRQGQRIERCIASIKKMPRIGGCVGCIEISTDLDMAQLDRPLPAGIKIYPFFKKMESLDLTGSLLISTNRFRQMFVGSCGAKYCGEYMREISPLSSLSTTKGFYSLGDGDSGNPSFIYVNGQMVPTFLYWTTFDHNGGNGGNGGIALQNPTYAKAIQDTVKSWEEGPVPQTCSSGE